MTTANSAALPENPAHSMADTLRGLPLAAWHGTRLFRPILLITILLTIGLAATQKGFSTWQNVQNLLTGISGVWIIALGMTFVLLTAGADLSVSAISALTGIFLAKIINDGVPGWPAVLLTLIFGFAIGAVINGGLIGRLRLSFFVVTLASSTALTGVVNLWSNTQSITLNSSVAADFGIKVVFGLPVPIWIMGVLFVVALYVQRYTYFGRDIYAVGGSIAAARLSGVRTTRTLVIAYGITGVCGTIAGIIAAGRIGVAAPNVDANLPLEAIAAVLLGGTSLAGGLGGVGGTVVGVLFLGVLSNGLSIAGVPTFWQQVVTGVILVVAVLGDQISLVRERLLRKPVGSGEPEATLKDAEVADLGGTVSPDGSGSQSGTVVNDGVNELPSTKIQPR
jgi:ribose transport system permease protein